MIKLPAKVVGIVIPADDIAAFFTDGTHHATVVDVAFHPLNNEITFYLTSGGYEEVKTFPAIPRHKASLLDAPLPELPEEADSEQHLTAES